MAMSEITRDTIHRRDLLRGSLMLAAVPRLCCTSPQVARNSFRFEGTALVLDLSKAPELRAPGSSCAVVDAERKLNIIVARVEKGRFVALDRS
jgi:hypothetical protein